MHRIAFYEAETVEIQAGDRTVELRALTVDPLPETLTASIWRRLRRRPRWSAIYFLRLLAKGQEGSYRAIARALAEFPAAVGCLELRYLMAGELIAVMQDFLAARRLPQSARVGPSNEGAEVAGSISTTSSPISSRPTGSSPEPSPGADSSPSVGDSTATKRAGAS